MSEIEPATAVVPLRVKIDDKVQAIRRRLARLSWPWVSYKAVSLFYASPFYTAMLSGKTPVSLLAVPPYPWPGDASHGASIILGRMSISGTVLEMGSNWDWRTVRAPAPVLAELHGFSWLSDLRTTAGDAARRRARELVASWIEAYPKWSRVAWQPHILGMRIAAWLSHYEFFCASADDMFREVFFRSVSQQARHLMRTVRLEDRPLPALLALKGALYAAICIPGLHAEQQDKLADLVKRLERELARQIRNDGGHAARSPSDHLSVLRLLIDIRAAFAAGGHEIPAALQTTIEIMAPALRQMRHGDGALAIFNGGIEEQAWIVDMVLSQADARSRPRRRMVETKANRDGGFERLMAGRMMVLIDAGVPPPLGFDHAAHAGVLSIEVSIGRDRLIVNCGALAVGRQGWAELPRTTAAHSVLIVDDKNSSEILPAGGLGHRPDRVTSIREESEGNIWIDTAHDGYERRFGLTHRRRLYLSAGGEDLRGEDSLEGEGNVEFALRFHLHPKVKAQITQDRNAILLQLGTSGWRLRVSGGDLALEESIYFGQGDLRRTEQVVIKGRTGKDGRPGAIVKWALRKERRS